MKHPGPTAARLVLALSLVVPSCAGPERADDATAAAARTFTPSQPGGWTALDAPASSASPAATTPWIPPGTFACPLGKGDPNAACGRGHEPPVFLAAVEAAIDELVRTRPELFDTTRVVGEKGYLVLDAEEMYLGVAALLQAQGFCAGWDLVELQVRNGAFSEQYDLLLSNGHLRRGEGSFRATCTPASFPLDAADRIAYVRVGFYAIECDDGRTPPRNGEKQLPVECTGFVTATPKDRSDADVDKRVHGPDIAWEVVQDGEWVHVEDFEGVAFNKFVRGLDPGRFSLCATVQGKRGCLDAVVIPR